MTTLVVSGKTPERIASMAGALAEWMEGAGATVRLPDVGRGRLLQRLPALLPTAILASREANVRLLPALQQVLPGGWLWTVSWLRPGRPNVGTLQRLLRRVWRQPVWRLLSEPVWLRF